MAVIATAEVRVIANTRGFLADLRRQLRRDLRSAFRDVNRQITASMREVGAQAGREFGNAMSRNMATAGTASASAFSNNFGQELGRGGDRAAATFGQRFRRSLTRALVIPGALLAFPENLLRSYSVLGREIAALARRSESFGDAFRAVEQGIRNTQQRIAVFGRTASANLNRAFSAIPGLPRVMQRASAALGSFGGELRGLGQNFRRFWDNDVVARARTAGREAAGVFTRSFNPVIGQLRSVFVRMGWGQAGDEAGREAGRGIARGVERETGRNLDRVARRQGRRFGRALIAPIVGSLSILGRAISSITITPLTALNQLFSELFTGLAEQFGLALIGVAVIEALAGALFILPAAIAVGIAAVATMRVALGGMGDAFRAALGPADAFEEAISDLAPAAQSAAREFRALRQDFSDIRIDVQQAAWEQLDGAITEVADNLMGPIRQGMIAASAELGGLIRGIANFAAEAETAETVAAVFEALRQVFAGLAGAAEPFLRGLRAIADEFLPLFDGIDDRLASVGERFEEWAVRITETGQAMDEFRKALAFLAGVRDLATDIGFIFAAMFDAAEEAGTSVMGVIGELISGLREVAESAEGQAALGDVFGGLEIIFRELAPVLGQVVALIGNVVVAIGMVAEAVGPSLGIIVGAIGDAIESLGRTTEPVFAAIGEAAEIIAPAIEPAVAAFGRLLSTLAPLIPVFGSFVGVILEVAAPFIDLLSHAIFPIVEALSGALMPIIQTLGQTLLRLIPIIVPVALALGEGLARVIETLAPILIEIVGVIADQLMPVFQALIPAIVPLIDVMVEWINASLIILTPILILIIELIGTLAPLFITLLEALTPLLEVLPDIITPLAEMAAIFLEAILPVLPIIIELIVALIDTGLKILVVIIENVVVPALDVLASVLGWVRDRLVDVIDWLQPMIDFVGRARDAIQKFSENVQKAIQWVIDFVRDMIDAFRDFRSAISSIISFAIGLVEDFGGDFEIAFGVVLAVLDEVSAGFSFLRDAASRAFSFITDNIPDLSGLTSWIPFANGGIVTSPTVGLVGEAGREVIIPMTRPERAAQLAQQSGLIDLLASRGALPSGDGDGGGRPIEVHVHSNTTNLDLLAHKTVRKLTAQMVVT